MKSQPVSTQTIHPTLLYFFRPPPARNNHPSHNRPRSTPHVRPLASHLHLRDSDTLRTCLRTILLGSMLMGHRHLQPRESHVYLHLDVSLGRRALLRLRVLVCFCGSLLRSLRHLLQHSRQLLFHLRLHSAAGNYGVEIVSARQLAVCLISREPMSRGCRRNCISSSTLQPMCPLGDDRWPPAMLRESCRDAKALAMHCLSSSVRSTPMG